MRREQAELQGRPRCGEGRPSHFHDMRLDPNTHAYVLATAFMTSITFAVFATNLIALVLSHLLN